MHTSLQSLLLATIILLATAPGVSAQPGHFPFKNAGDSLKTIELVKGYLQFTQRDPMPIDSIKTYAVDEFATWLDKAYGVPIRFPDRAAFRIDGARAVREDGSLALVTVTADADSVPLFGPLAIEWVFFTKAVEGKGWRISALRRQTGLEGAAQALEYLDTSALYPHSLKPLVARETGRALLSNDQLRHNYLENRDAFTTLAGFFHQKDSLWMLGRIDASVAQLNQFGIDWGDGAENIPREAVTEMMKKLTPDQREAFTSHIRAAERAQIRGRDTLTRIAKRIGISIAKIDSATDMMRKLRVSFINARLPWNNAVQFTVGGKRDDVLGYLYSPSGEIPWISPEEYFYLEDLGNGWWIFRAT